MTNISDGYTGPVELYHVLSSQKIWNIQVNLYRGWSMMHI